MNNEPRAKACPSKLGRAKRGAKYHDSATRTRLRPDCVGATPRQALTTSDFTTSDFTTSDFTTSDLLTSDFTTSDLLTSDFTTSDLPTSDL